MSSNTCRVAIYVRVSTLDQVGNGYSLDAQERVLRQWCSERKYKIFNVYADKGISGKDIDHRPEMIRMLHDAQENKFDIILFWALSRLTRSVSDLYKAMMLFQKCGVAMVSYTESFDTSTPMGRAMIGIIGVFAQLEREVTAERVSAAAEERAMQGKRTCSEALGYDIDGKDSFKINSKEAEYVRFCFNEYLKCKNLSKVAAEARKRGYKGKRGKAPTAWSVEVILSRPIYCGYNIFKGNLYKGWHKPIIDIITYNRVISLLLKQGKVYGRKAKKMMQTIKINHIAEDKQNEII